MADPSAVIRQTLSDPDRLLGVVERNVEVKLIGPLLELLGWDPASQVLWGPQVRRHTALGHQGVEADAFVADIIENQLRFIVEAKRWARPLDAQSIVQTLRYLDDVGAQRALLTNGIRWLVVDVGRPEPLLAHTIPAGATDNTIAALVQALATFLSPSTAPTSPLPSAQKGTAAADVDQLAEDNHLVGELVSGLRALAAEEAERIYIDPGPKGLLVRVHRNGHVIVPVNARDPLKPELYSQELDALGVDAAVRGAYVVALRRLPRERSVEAVAAFLAALGAVVASLP